MKVLITLALLTFSWHSYAGIFSDLIGYGNPTERCTESLSRHYNIDATMVRGCNEHKTKYANQCVDTVIKFNGQMHPKTPLICSYYNSQWGIEIMEEYAYRFRLDVKNQLIFSHVDTEKENRCLLNMLRVNNLEYHDLESCLQDTYKKRKNRGIKTIGFSLATEPEGKNLLEKTRDYLRKFFK